ncbi:cation-transporting P-type ATPase [Mesorhizobium caraganae]|uniref:cation-transporting P-type ATPase n=1 Tax=Mesorhizobium caraganae TaxID=483206 RepID=UPI003F50B086
MIENPASPTWRGVGEPYWSRPAIEVLQECRSRPTGLTSTEARNGLSRHRPNTFAYHRREQAPAVLLRQFCNPLVLVLIVAPRGLHRQRRARHGRATVRGPIENARSAGHPQGALPLAAGPELEATEGYRR